MERLGNEKARESGRKPSKTAKVVASVVVVIGVVALVLIFADIVGISFWGLSPARNLSGTWTSTFDCEYYELDPFDYTRTTKVWGHFEIQIEQNGETVTGIADIIPTSYQYLTDIHIPPVNHHFRFSGIVEGANMTINYDEGGGGGSWLIIQMRFAFTSDHMTGTISGTMIDSDTNAIVLTKQ